MEKKLPHPYRSKRSVGAVRTDKIEFFARTADYEVQTLEARDDYERFIKILEPYNLSSLQREILINTFYYQKTQAEIAEELRLPHAVAVNRELKHILNLLKQRGFKLEQA